MDSQRNGSFTVTCRTLYDIKLKKHETKQVERTKIVSYKDFNNLFGIKKHELDRNQLCMFGAKYIESL